MVVFEIKNNSYRICLNLEIEARQVKSIPTLNKKAKFREVSGLKDFEW